MTLRLTLLACVSSVASTQVAQLAAQAAAVTSLVTSAQQTPRKERVAPPPAPFQQPAVGTVYRYEGFTNRIVGGNGIVTGYVDDANRAGTRFGVFFNDNPDEPLAYSPESVRALFPLRVGKKTTFTVTRGDLKWTFTARVVDTERITTPAGTFDTWVVETIETPKRTRDPATVKTRISTFWYAPSIRNVARLMTITTTATGEKTLRKVQLLGVDPPSAKR